MFASVSSELAMSFTAVALTVSLPTAWSAATVRVPSWAITVPSARLTPSVADSTDHVIAESFVISIFLSASAYTVALYVPFWPICTSVFVLETTTLSTSALTKSAVTAIALSSPVTVYVYFPSTAVTAVPFTFTADSFFPAGTVGVIVITSSFTTCALSTVTSVAVTLIGVTYDGSLM